jgi:superoxide reductase
MENREDKIYVCKICGNQVKFVEDGGGTLVCCGDPMTEKE